MKNKIKLIIPFYNPGEFLDLAINSALTQDYDNYDIIFVDDCSTDSSLYKMPGDVFKMKDDGTLEVDSSGNPVVLSSNPVSKKTNCKNITSLRMGQQNTALQNIHNTIMNFCKDPDDIIVLLDGDDWFPNKKVLSQVNDIYNNNDCWITYGQATWTDGRKGCASQYLREEFENVRKAPFRISHLRTWRAGLYHKIAEQDPEFNHFKDASGKFYRWSWDTAIMFCLLELAGYDKVKYNESILYVYNRDNPISEDKINQQAQWSVHAEVSNKLKLKQIESYK